jgi:hypothetical protein
MICGTGKFSILEQLWMQISFNGIWILGFVAIFLVNPLFAIVYILLIVGGVLLFIVHLWICPRCPHILKHKSCLQLPPFITKRLIKKNVFGELKVYEKIGFFVFLYGIIILPLPWVVGNQHLLIPYIIFGLMH